MSAWQDGGCPLKSFVVEYRQYGHDAWKTVANSVDPSQVMFRILDLEPGTHYTLRVTAHNEAGSTTAQYDLSTLMHVGQTADPRAVFGDGDIAFYQDIATIVPIVGGILLFLILLVVLILYIRKKKMKHYAYTYKEDNNIKKDLTAETALICDQADKKLRDSTCSMSPEHLPSALRRESDTTRGWQPAPVRAVNADLVTETSPYATYTICPPPTSSSYDLLCHLSPSADNAGENIYQSVQPVTSNRNNRPTPFPFPVTDLPSPDTPQPRGGEMPMNPVRPQFRGGNEIRGILGGVQVLPHGGLPPAHPNLPLGRKVLTPKVLSPIGRDLKRQSVASNATDVSSNHDELIRAYENYKRHPAAPIEEREISGTPAVARVEPEPEIPEDSDSGENSATDPGILRFTQTPPTINEQRESTCIMPAYSQETILPHNTSALTKRASVSSDTTTDQDVQPPRERPKRPKRTRSQTSVQQRRSSQSGKSPRNPGRRRTGGSSTDEEETTPSPPDVQPAYMRSSSHASSHTYSDIDSPESPAGSRIGSTRAPDPRIQLNASPRESVDLLERPNGRQPENSPKIVIKLGDDDEEEDRGYTHRYTIV
ncbi:PREDICTED: Down syndrome cell adhesion molecule homolog isoform X2 [Priapulus caudatus]|uniref:Down syndrome cell adhesion molecule homolog isoform X2 n=1 Tax=Priapulus caudatus TaxID=37621 RepID=A0ABM1EKK1_PRICU|nr:PREDICTED: Down syndrome cell adhesion molecule homolog isoform X2 [Priapulus caudatus]